MAISRRVQDIVEISMLDDTVKMTNKIFSIASFVGSLMKNSQNYDDRPLKISPKFTSVSIALGVKPVKQKLQKMHPHVALLVKAKLEKLLKVEFIKETDYVEWISNIVPVSKPDKSIRVCTDFRDLNKACPKDDFPLPNIDIIVDMIVGYERYSLMDDFFGYNQIKIALEDQEKTMFTYE